MTDPNTGHAAPTPGSGALRRGSAAAAGLTLGTATLATLVGLVLALTGGGAATGLPFPLISGALALGTAAGILLRRRVELVGVISAIAAIGCGSSVFASGATAVAGQAFAPILIAGTLWMPGSLVAVSVLAHAVVTRRLGLVGVGGAAALVLWAATVANLVPGVASPGWAAAEQAAGVGWVLVALTGAAGLIREWWVGEGSIRDAAGWLGIAQSSVLLAAVPSYSGIAGVTGAAASLAAAILPAAVVLLAAVLLLTGLTSGGAPVDVSLARVVFWVLLAVALVVGLVAIVTAAAGFAPVTPTTAGMFAVAGLALAIEPARRWVQRAVDQLAYGRSAEPEALVRALGEALTRFDDGGPDAAPNPDVLDNIAVALRESLRLVSVELVSATPGGVVAAAGVPVPRSRGVQIILPGPDGPAGALRVTGVAGGVVDRRTQRVLGSIAGILALAVRLADMNSEIEQARAQVLDMASQEHRLVRSELVDGVAAGVRSARRAVARASRHAADDPGAARVLLDQASQSLSVVTREVRDLARTLLPGALDAGDAAGALSELATRFDRPLVVIDVDETIPFADATGMALAYQLMADAILGARRDPGVQAIRVSATAANAATRIAVKFEGDRGAPERAGERLIERARAAGAAVTLTSGDPGSFEVVLGVSA